MTNGQGHTTSPSEGEGEYLFTSALLRVLVIRTVVPCFAIVASIS